MLLPYLRLTFLRKSGHGEGKGQSFSVNITLTGDFSKK